MRNINKREKPKKVAVIKRQLVYDDSGRLVEINKNIVDNEVITEYKYI